MNIYIGIAMVIAVLFIAYRLRWIFEEQIESIDLDLLLDGERTEKWILLPFPRKKVLIVKKHKPK